MAIEHLIGRRTGRPSGSRSAPRWLRALRWAERNLGRPEAEPPSALAALLVAFGREHPDRFVTCLAMVEAVTSPKRQGAQVEKAEPKPVVNGPIPVSGGQSRRRLRKLVIDRKNLMYLVAGIPFQLDFPELPQRFEVVDFTVDRTRDIITLSLHSE